MSPRPGRLVSCLLERQLNLALPLGALMLAVRDRAGCRFNAERLQQSHDLGSHRLVDPQRAKRDTGRGSGVAPRRVAIIAADVTLRAVVADQQPASAMATTHEAGEQSLSLAHRAAHHHAFTVGIVGDQPLVPFIVRPGQIPLVMVDEQDCPVRAILAIAAKDTLAAVFDRRPAAGSAKGIGTRIDRIGKKVIHRRVDRKLPQQLMLSCASRIDVR